MALCTLPGVAHPSTAFMPKYLISQVFSVTVEPLLREAAYLRDGVGCWEFCHGQGTGDLLREENSGSIFCFRIVGECAFEARKKMPFPATRKQERQDLRSQAQRDSCHCIYGEPCVCVLFTHDPHPGRKMSGGPPGTPTQQGTGTGWPHAVKSVLVWETGTWIWDCQTLRDPSQHPLSRNKARHTQALPGGEPARSPPGSSATLGGIWSPSRWAEIEEEEKDIRYEWRSGRGELGSRQEDHEALPLLFGAYRFIRGQLETENPEAAFAKGKAD